MLKLVKYYPFILFLFFIFIFFHKTFLHGLIPFPGDITVGIYFPWHDYIWPGFPSGIPVKNALPSDIPSAILPFRQLAIDIVKSGHLPDWNKFILSGTPLL